MVLNQLVRRSITLKLTQIIKSTCYDATDWTTTYTKIRIEILSKNRHPNNLVSPIHVNIKTTYNDLRRELFNIVKRKGGCYIFIMTKGCRNGCLKDQNEKLKTVDYLLFTINLQQN